jgi:formylmethanofuran dehydrogenase subunit E-like metal-binding protein
VNEVIINAKKNPKKYADAKLGRLIVKSSVLVIEIGGIAKLKNRTSKDLIKETINEKAIANEKAVKAIKKAIK